MEAQVMVLPVVMLEAVEERVDWVAGKVVEEARSVEVVEPRPADREVVDLVKAVEVARAVDQEAVKVKSEASPAGWEGTVAILVVAAGVVAVAAVGMVVATVAVARVVVAARVVAQMVAAEEWEPVPARKVAPTVAAERVLE